MSGAPVRVLLLEDQEPDARHIMDLLRGVQDVNFVVDRGRSVTEIITLLTGQHYDVALLDLCVDDSKGLPTLRRVREKASHLPVVVQSDLSARELMLDAVRDGAQDYILKSEITERVLVRSLRYAIERHRIEQQLRESKERYELAVRGANDGLWDWDLRNNSIYFSRRWQRMLGAENEELGDSPEAWFSRIHPQDYESVAKAIKAHLEGLTPHLEHEYRVVHGNGDVRWLLCRGLAVRDSNDQAYRLAGSQTDITERKHAEARLLHDAFHDALTGLPNRALFLDRLGQALRRRERRQNYNFAVLFLDLDRFKLINDSWGHTIGDELLVEIAERLKHSLRPGDTVARLGGDEFAILLDDLQQVSESQAAAERIQERLSQPVVISGHEVFTSASIGITYGVQDYNRPEDLLRDADTAMYRAKAAGRARHVVFDATLHTSTVRRLELETELRYALDRDEIRVVYQPIVALEDGRLRGFEALARWQSPGRGAIEPGEFIPVAEETGLIIRLGECVLREACSHIAAWKMADNGAHSDITMSVNVSSRQFLNKDLVQRIEAVLEETQCPPQALVLEITESVLMERTDIATTMLAQLRALGVKIHIDDFGTGYSSLSYLHSFPIDRLKIDRSFVQGMTQGKSEYEIVRAILSLAQSLDIGVIAEGIETDEQLERLRLLNCESGQGFLFSRPLEPDHVIVQHPYLAAENTPSLGHDGQTRHRLRNAI